MSYKPLKAVTALAAADTTGKNPGNLTCAFDDSTQGMPSVNVWRIHHMVVSGGPALAYASIILTGNPYSFVTLDVNGGNEWDPSQPAFMRKSYSMYYFWNIAAPGTPGQIPLVTIWPEWDPDDTENKGLS